METKHLPFKIMRGQYPSEYEMTVIEHSAYLEKCEELERTEKVYRMNREAIHQMKEQLEEYRKTITLQGDKVAKFEAALELTLYYIEGDATYEGLIQQIKDRFGIDPNGNGK